MKSKRFSLAAKILIVTSSTLFCSSALTMTLLLLGLNSLLATLIATIISLILLLVLLERVTGPIYRGLQSLRDGADNLKDRDFSVRITGSHVDEVGELVSIFNDVTRTLQDERFDLYQRELLLNTVVENAPLALVLIDPRGRIRFHNRTARKLFDLRHDDAAKTFFEILERCPSQIREAVEKQSDSLVNFERNGVLETFHLVKRTFSLSAMPHELLLFRPMTREISREEVAVWKKVIRLIAHELNNSLAPISSLIHSARKLTEQPDKRLQQERVFVSIQERLESLQGFLEGYAQFARLPLPIKSRVNWREFLGRVQTLFPFELQGELPGESGWFDATQMEQVLINLIKNAHEAGSSPKDIRVEVLKKATTLNVVVLDRGPGMDEHALKRALQPFFSTKTRGSGLGLALCREIIVSHDGYLDIKNREGGGLQVTCALPLDVNGVNESKH